jgi:hypothetical protein
MTDMLARVPDRSKDMLKNMLRDRIITPEGLEWLIAATDPFHDSQLTWNGFPDVASTNSVSQCVPLTTSVSLATGKDLHVFFAPFSQMWGIGDELAPFTIRDTGAQGDPNLGGATIVSGYNLITVDSAADWRTSPTAANPSFALTIPRSFSYGQFRLVGAGLEIVNTSPKINQGGSITVYRVPNAVVDSYVLRDYEITTPAGFALQKQKHQPTSKRHPERNVEENSSKRTSLDASVHFYATYPVTFGTLPPGTQAQACLYPNSRTWNGEQGVYQVAVMNSIEQNFTSTVPGVPGFLEVPAQSTLESDTDRVAYLPIAMFTTTDTSSLSNNSHLFRYDVSGVVIRNGTGLTNTYQVTVKYFIEKIPTDTDQALLVLSRPPAPYDPVILEIYSRVMQKMPVGVPVGENPLGEWFNDVMEGVATVLPIIGQALTPFFGPAKMIGDALGAGAKQLAVNNRAATAAELQRRAQQSEEDKRKAQASKDIRPAEALVLPPTARIGRKN